MSKTPERITIVNTSPFVAAFLCVLCVLCGEWSLFVNPHFPITSQLAPET
jgi:hypothetical protein